MSRSYFELRYLFEHRIRRLIWFSTDDGQADGVLTGATGGVLAFRMQQELVAYAKAEGIELVQEIPILHNLDIVRIWLKRKKPGRIDCNAFLTAWNLFTDLAASVGGSFEIDRDRTDTIYQKLFWGNNLPALTLPGKCYMPLWSRREHRLMRKILREGIVLLRSSVRLQESTAPDELLDKAPYRMP